jgi:ubiquinone/menaquinone biosynthesis C-methylase UbiE
VSATSDRWADWLRTRRTGGSEQERRKVLEFLAPVRDKLLDDAEVGPGDTVLDVGCGDGLVGLGALDRGADVIFSDLSGACLDDCRAIAGDVARYHLAPATDLGDVEADVVTTRSVLIYVEDKARAFEEVFRVLRPGGRFSIYEPINAFARAEAWERRFWLYPADGLADLAEKVSGVYKARQDPQADPMFDFDERDLVGFAEEAGFFPVELELRMEVRAADPHPWEVFLNSSGNPKIPTFAEAMEEALSPAERKRVAAHLKPLVEEGRGVWRMAHAYLWATKPAPSP